MDETENEKMHEFKASNLPNIIDQLDEVLTTMMIISPCDRADIRMVHQALELLQQAL